MTNAEARVTFLVAMLAGAACAISPQARLRSGYELALHAERLTEAVVDNRPRDIYQMFVPGFTAENSYPTFDSAFEHWYGGRRIVRASHKVVDVQGPAGYVSSWFVFEGDRDYNYIYQNWLNTDDSGWQLVWMSRVLDTSFSYGQTDSPQLARAAEAGLRYVLSKPGLAQFHAGYSRPDTVVMVRFDRPGEDELSHVDSLPVYWTTVAQIKQGVHIPRTQFLLNLALVRLMGDMALVVLDVTPTGRDLLGRRHRPRGLEVYVKRVGADWRFYDVGKKW